MRRDPRPKGSLKLKGGGSLYRIRVGVHRVVYDIDDASRLIVIARARRRRSGRCDRTDNRRPRRKHQSSTVGRNSSVLWERYPGNGACATYPLSPWAGEGEGGGSVLVVDFINFP
ncbi:MAG: hypothetical protein Q7T82_18480 [Armatimonadota bacterium]|nr:hypothetical protein [Armatimonadota bacterium]